ncbi:MAG: phosphatidylserine/phosphatidylglycerophosphate/cardiolipin synthase family protein [Gammaproteobacteria bacterium]|nr:phosphatidylserine/phosphatidylglycerophosphate/cardiolipin synthase family protein [Gammaproteobacteria bacterium]NND37058.1 phosphatidylserine/phosphatidylglycerophosphate/cardiolipin synthase family protein [Gammaproteobacteria bacterium]
MGHSTILLSGALATLAIAASCGAQAARTNAEYPTIPGRFAEEIITEPLVAVEAFIDDTDFYVRYRDAQGMAWSGGSWASRIGLGEIEAGETYGGPYILPLEYHRREPWSEPPDERIGGRILSMKDWRVFRDRLVAAIVPRTGSVGVALHFYADDYFIYYDETGVFHAQRLLDKPDDYTVGESLSFLDFVRRGVPVLEAFLAEHGIEDRRIVFNTGDVGAYSLPFLYVNLDLPLAVFARYEPPHVMRRSSSSASPYIQTAGHVTRSHLFSMVFRPVSSVFRLFFVATDATYETIRPDWVVELGANPIPAVAEGPGMDLDAWEAELDELTGRPTSSGTIEYLIDGEAFFTRLIDAVTTADESIHLRTYIFDNDDYAERIGELLKRRSNEGIEVKMLFDGLGTIISTMETQDTLPEDWHGSESVHRFLEEGSQIDVRQAPNPWLTGDHVKTITIDRRVAFTGGMNIAREYRYDWHDMMMELHGPVVDLLQDEFDKAWARAGFLGDFGYVLERLRIGNRKVGEAGYPVRVLFTRTGDREIFRAQKQAIRNAQRYIFVENAYFTDDAMLYELVKARRRGVDVRVIMPLVTDRGPITRNNALAANVMLENGIRVFVYPGMSHVKAAVFDGWACLGSANWDKWSLAINKELNLATSHAPSVDGLLEQLFEPDFTKSVELTEPFPERWSDFLLEFVGDFVF